MSEALPWSVIVVYSIYVAFATFQKFCIQDFRGRSEIYKFVLSFFALITSLFGVGFLIYYGFKTLWWTPFALFGIGILAYFILGFIEQLIPMWLLGLISFIVIPICGALLIYLTP